MKHPVSLNIQNQFPDVTISYKAPANSTYRIPYAETSCWKNENFIIVEQEYDGKDAYLSLIEIKNKERLSFIINTNTTDLFWYYQLKGAIEIRQHPPKAEPDGFVNRMQEDEYVLFYSPPREYRVTLEPGNHMLFFFVVDATWLQRHPVLEPTHYQKLIKLLQHRTDDYNSTKILQIHSVIRKEILHLFTMPNFEEMEMDANVYPPLVSLISFSREDLQDKTMQLSRDAKQLLRHIREYCEKQLSNGILPPNKEIAEHFKRSEQYIARIHKREYGETLQNFQIATRLEIARQQVRETKKSLTEVAYDLGFSDLSHFISQYQKHFRITPTQERLTTRK